jgi:hypothetical protein
LNARRSDFFAIGALPWRLNKVYYSKKIYGTSGAIIGIAFAWVVLLL